MNVYMIVVIFAAVLLLLGLAWYLAPALRGRGGDEELGELPDTPLQRRARWVLAFGVVWCGALLWILLRTDPVMMMEDRGERLLFTAVLLGGLLAYVGMTLLMRRGRGGEVAIDERDRQILARAAEVQGGLTVMCVAAWSIGLTEMYWDTGQVPIAFPSIVFWSTFVVYLVSHSAGILLGYAMWRGDAEG